MHSSITISGLTDVGQIRRRNEDSYAVVPELGIAVVADGMGGHPGGDVASRIAAETAAKALVDAVKGFRDERQEAANAGGGAQGFRDRFGPLMKEIVLRAHQAVREEATIQPKLDGMGTTLTVMVVDATTRAWVIGHVGDSRAYRFRDGDLEQITRDDTWIQEQIEQGTMQPESAKLSPYAHLLTQCVGLEDPPTPHVLEGEGAPGERYLLCTDGLVGMVDDESVARILDESSPLETMVARANEAGGHDNITAALVRID